MFSKDNYYCQYSFIQTCPVLFLSKCSTSFTWPRHLNKNKKIVYFLWFSCWNGRISIFLLLTDKKRKLFTNLYRCEIINVLAFFLGRKFTYTLLQLRAKLFTYTKCSPKITRCLKGEWYMFLNGFYWCLLVFKYLNGQIEFVQIVD